MYIQNIVIQCDTVGLFDIKKPKRPTKTFPMNQKSKMQNFVVQLLNTVQRNNLSKIKITSEKNKNQQKTEKKPKQNKSPKQSLKILNPS